MQQTGKASRSLTCDKRTVHRWRVFQLNRLGITGNLAEDYADRIDWHEVARLVLKGCPPELALHIVG